MVYSQNPTDTSVEQGLVALCKYDAYLLESKANERSITHRLGMYYQGIFIGWDVDCEFNINVGSPKRINIDPNDFVRRMASLVRQDREVISRLKRKGLFIDEEISAADLHELYKQLSDEKRLIYSAEFDVVFFALKLSDEKTEWKTIYPDIIVHHRSTRENHIVIEAKKSTNNNALSRAYDLIKLTVLTNDPEFNYDYGYFLDIPVGSHYSSKLKFEFRPDLLESKITKVRSYKL
jgi:hypothetical protein